MHTAFDRMNTEYARAAQRCVPPRPLSIGLWLALAEYARPC
jgi:hypothetical protein